MLCAGSKQRATTTQPGLGGRRAYIHVCTQAGLTCAEPQSTCPSRLSRGAAGDTGSSSSSGNEGSVCRSPAAGRRHGAGQGGADNRPVELRCRRYRRALRTLHARSRSRACDRSGSAQRRMFTKTEKAFADPPESSGLSITSVFSCLNRLDVAAARPPKRGPPPSNSSAPARSSEFSTEAGGGRAARQV